MQEKPETEDVESASFDYNAHSDRWASLDAQVLVNQSPENLEAVVLLYKKLSNRNAGVPSIFKQFLNNAKTSLLGNNLVVAQQFVDEMKYPPMHPLAKLISTIDTENSFSQRDFLRIVDGFLRVLNSPNLETVLLLSDLAKKNNNPESNRPPLSEHGDADYEHEGQNDSFDGIGELEDLSLIHI